MPEIFIAIWQQALAWLVGGALTVGYVVAARRKGSA